jgi:hypothetical protein
VGEGVERMALALQVLGGLAVVLGLFAALRWELAVLIVGILVLAVGTVLEVAHHPRVHTMAVPSLAEQRAHSLADRAQHASGR